MVLRKLLRILSKPRRTSKRFAPRGRRKASVLKQVCGAVPFCQLLEKETHRTSCLLLRRRWHPSGLHPYPLECEQYSNAASPAFEQMMLPPPTQNSPFASVNTSPPVNFSNREPNDESRGCSERHADKGTPCCKGPSRPHIARCACDANDSSSRACEC